MVSGIPDPGGMRISTKLVNSLGFPIVNSGSSLISRRAEAIGIPFTADHFESSVRC